MESVSELSEQLDDNAAQAPPDSGPIVGDPDVEALEALSEAIGGDPDVEALEGLEALEAAGCRVVPGEVGAAFSLSLAKHAAALEVEGWGAFAPRGFTTGGGADPDKSYYNVATEREPPHRRYAVRSRNLAALTKVEVQQAADEISIMARVSHASLTLFR